MRQFPRPAFDWRHLPIYRMNQYYLEKHGYITLAHADVDHGTYCCDGVLVARRHDLEGLEPLDIPLRDPCGQQRAEQQMRGLSAEAPTRRFLPALGQLWYRFTGEMRLHPRQLDAKTSSRDP